MLLALFVLCFLSLYATAQETVEQWKAKTIEKYPDLAVTGSAFNKQFVADYRNRQKAEPKLFENPQWPMIIAEGVAKQLKAKIPGIDILEEEPEAKQKPQIKLVTPEDIKKKWLEDLPQPRGLDPNYHKLQKAAASKKKAIESGNYDDRANKEAARINTATLLAVGFTKEAEIMQQMLAAQEAKDEREEAAAQANIQRAMDQMALDDIRRGIEQQNRELQDVSRKLGN